MRCGGKEHCELVINGDWATSSTTGSAFTSASIPPQSVLPNLHRICRAFGDDPAAHSRDYRSGEYAMQMPLGPLYDLLSPPQVDRPLYRRRRVDAGTT